MASLTLVTALFDLPRRERNPDRTPIGDYLRHGEFLLRLEHDIVFFVDEEFEGHVVERRRACGLLDRTVVVATPLEALRTQPLVARIAAARRRNPVLNADPAKDTPRYVGLTWSKFVLLDEAIALDPFGSTHFAWIDFGLGVVETKHHAEDGVFARSPDKVRLLMMKSFTADEVAESTYYRYLRGHVAAGYVSGGRATLRRICDLLLAEAECELERGCAPSEEQLLPVICARHPDLFEFHYGDYRHILDNYVRLRGSAQNLLFQMRHCRSVSNFRRGYEIGVRILASYRAATFECDAAELATLFDEFFIAAYYAEYPRQDAARDVARLYADLAHADHNFREIFLRSEIRIRNNFSLLSDPVTL
jgi:hypothetical protein